MRPYLSIFSARMRTLLQYRAAAMAGVGTQLFWGFIRIMIFDAFYRSTRTAPSLTWEQMVSYIWLGQAMLGLMPWRGDREVHEMIRTGGVANELLRPLDLYGLWYSRSVAMQFAPTLLRSVPQFVLAGFFFGLQAPASLASAAAWVLATAMAFLLSGAIATLITMSLLWTVSGEGISLITTAMMPLLAGLIVPLPFFPDWAQAILNFLPFRGMMDVPFRLYVGHIPPERIVFVLAHQLAWTLALVMFGRWLLARALRQLVVQGG
jgi:ABC-2 type transport system permease protein